MKHDELIDLEKQGWQALSATGTTAAAFYEDVLAEKVLMLLPGGVVLDDRAQIVESMSGQPWSRHELGGMRVFEPGPDTGVVAYGVVAARENGPEYAALVSSLYVRRDGGWKLAFHQQTPR